MREKVAIVRPTLRTEVKEPRVLRFDPASKAVWSLAVLADVAPTLAISCAALPPARGQAGLGAALRRSESG